MRWPTGYDSSVILWATCSSCGRDRSANSVRLVSMSASSCWVMAMVDRSSGLVLPSDGGIRRAAAAGGGAAGGRGGADGKGEGQLRCVLGSLLPARRGGGAPGGGFPQKPRPGR